MASISFDEDALKPVVAAAIMQQISSEQRDHLVEQAVKSLITPARDGYTRGQTPLQEAFDMGVRRAANAAVDQVIAENPAMQERIRATLTKAVADLMDSNYNLQQIVLEALAGALVHRES